MLDEKRTDTSHYKGDKVPAAGLDELVAMVDGCDCEEKDEDDCCCY